MITYKQAAERLQAIGHCPPGNFIVMPFTVPRQPLEFGKPPTYWRNCLVSYERQQGDQLINTRIERDLSDAEFTYACGFTDEIVEHPSHSVPMGVE